MPPHSRETAQITYRSQITSFTSFGFIRVNRRHRMFIKLVIITFLQILVRRLDFFDCGAQFVLMFGLVRHCSRPCAFTEGDQDDFRDHDGTLRDGNAGYADVQSRRAGCDWHWHEYDDGSPLHDDVQEMRRGDEDRLCLRRQSLGDDASESVHDDARRSVQLLLYAEWDDGLLLHRDGDAA